MEESTKPLDILLAEDDQDDVAIFKTALHDTGISYEFRHAADGDVLFVLLKDNIPYILFLDIQMPCKDGIACILEIRKDRRYDGMPVVMYTSHYRDEYVNDSYRAGANFFVRKRERYSEMVKDLKAILNTDWGKNLYYPPLDGFVWKQD